MPELQIVTCSVRPSRKGHRVAEWFSQRARAHGAFEVVPVDLMEVALPITDEPEHPRFRRYQHEHTKAWSATVGRADAFVFVTPEYNYGSPPALINALDALYHEWSFKPVGFVSYGGVSAGLRSVQMTKLVVTTLNMMPIPTGVAIPSFTDRLPDAGGPFVSEAGPTTRPRRCSTSSPCGRARCARSGGRDYARRARRSARYSRRVPRIAVRTRMTVARPTA